MYNLSESRKHASSSFYTLNLLQKVLVSSLDIQSHALEEGFSVLDPCCGSGALLVRFLVEYSVQVFEHLLIDQKRPLILNSIRKLIRERLYGIDTDPDALNFLKAYLRQVCGTTESNSWEDNFVVSNSLELSMQNLNLSMSRVLAFSRGFSVIICNPPWKLESIFQSENSQDAIKVKKKLPEEGKINFWSLFFRKCVEMIRPGGFMSILVPETLVAEISQAPIRRFLFEEGNVKVLSLLHFSERRIWKEVGTGFVRLLIQKNRFFLLGQASSTREFQWNFNIGHANDLLPSRSFSLNIQDLIFPDPCFFIIPLVRTQGLDILKRIHSKSFLKLGEVLELHRGKQAGKQGGALGTSGLRSLSGTEIHSCRIESQSCDEFLSSLDTSIQVLVTRRIIFQVQRSDESLLLLEQT